MTERATQTFTGLQYHYSYKLYRLDDDFPEGAGNYIFAKTAPNTDYWQVLYIGETSELNVRLSSGDERHKCAIKKGATHIFIHENSKDKSGRLAEEKDLFNKCFPSQSP